MYNTKILKKYVKRIYSEFNAESMIGTSAHFYVHDLLNIRTYSMQHLFPRQLANFASQVCLKYYEI